MKQINIPRIGQIVECVEPWTVGIYRDWFNYNLIRLLTGDTDMWNGNKITFYTFPVGTQFKVFNYSFLKSRLEAQQVKLTLWHTDDSKFTEVSGVKKRKVKTIKVRLSARIGDFTNGALSFEEPND